MKSKVYIIISIVLIALGVFLLYEGWAVFLRFFDIIKRYQWVGVGIVAFVGLHYFIIRKHKGEANYEWAKTFSHELTHTIVAMLCFREITSFKAEQGEGLIRSRGSDWAAAFVSLAPYCLPIFTYIMLFIWSLVASRSLVSTNSLWAIDIIVGITIAFHFFCFKEQTGDYQTDIKKFPRMFSYTFIWFFRILNILIILLCYMPNKQTGQPLKVWGAFWYLICQFWNDIGQF